MRVVTAPEQYQLQPHEIGVFLAGGITNCPNWQKDIIERIKENWIEDSTKNLVLFNPRRENFPIDDTYAAYEQIQWEFDQLEKCDIFSMYFCAGESDQPICMYELGRNILRMQNKFPTDWKKRIIISVEDGYKRKEDVLIQTELATHLDLVNTQVSQDTLMFYHTENIYRAYKKILNKW